MNQRGNLTNLAQLETCRYIIKYSLSWAQTFVAHN